MKSYLRTETIDVAGVGKVQIRELSAAARVEMFEFQRADAKNESHLTGLTCKLGVVEWAAEKLEDIEASVGAAPLSEIAAAIYKLSGVDLAKKDSETGPSEPSSSA